jgi:hypothetical protein
MEVLPKLENRGPACSIVKDSPTTNTPEKQKKLSEQTHEQDKVIITKCLTKSCPGIYTDSLSESVLIICNDPIHAKSKREGSNISAI